MYGYHVGIVYAMLYICYFALSFELDAVIRCNFLNHLLIIERILQFFAKLEYSLLALFAIAEVWGEKYELGAMLFNRACKNEVRN